LAKLFGVDLGKLDDLPARKYTLFEEVSAINHVARDAPGPRRRAGVLSLRQANKRGPPCKRWTKT
jgi:hypothetical protein